MTNKIAMSSYLLGPSGYSQCEDLAQWPDAVTLEAKNLAAAARQAQEAHRAVPNEALYGDLRICSLISCTYLFELLNKL